MGVEVTPERAMRYTELVTGNVFCWPPKRDASRLKVISFQIGWWISWSITVIMLLPLIMTCYQRRNSFMDLTKFICIAVCLVQVIIKMILCKLQYHRFQDLFAEMECFIKEADSHERQVLTEYTKLVAPHHLRYNYVSFGAGAMMILGPLSLDQPLPTEAEYPFPVDQHPMYEIIYFLESFVALQCCCTGPLDCQICLLLWFATCRLKLLAERLKNVRSSHELKECIKIHQHLLWYIDESIKASKGVVATTIIFATVSIVCGSIHIIGHAPMEERIQFIGIYFGYILELLSIAWAAENMMEACEDIGWAIYDSPWIKNSKECNTTAIFVMQRAKKVPKYEIGGLLPELSLAYYAQYVSKTFSFFTTLHVMLEKMGEIA